MNTRNWQIKMLTLCMAAFALCLTVACGDEYLTDYPYPDEGLRIVSLEPCEIDVPLIPSIEFIKLAEKWMQPGDDISYEALRELSGYRASVRAREKRLSPEFKRIRDALQPQKYQIYEFPYYSWSDVEALNTWDGTPTDKLVVVVHLSHLVDMRTVRPEALIPGCIAGVPVHIIFGQLSERVFEYSVTKWQKTLEKVRI